MPEAIINAAELIAVVANPEGNPSDKVISTVNQLAQKKDDLASLLAEFPRGRTFLDDIKTDAEVRQQAGERLAQWSSQVTRAQSRMSSRDAIATEVRSTRSCQVVLPGVREVVGLDMFLQQISVDPESLRYCLQTRKAVIELLEALTANMMRSWVYIWVTKLKMEVGRVSGRRACKPISDNM